MHPKLHKFLRFVEWSLIFLLTIKIAGFFSWSENVSITRVIKILLRMISSGGMVILYFWLKKKGLPMTVRWNHPLTYILYGAYLMLGLASLMWSTNPGYSGLQWVMTSESLLFCFLLARIIMATRVHLNGNFHVVYRILGTSTFLIMLIFIIGKFVNPDLFFRLTRGGEEARLGGWMMNPNELGMMGAVGVASLILAIKDWKKDILHIIMIILLMYGVLLTGSRSTLIAVGGIMAIHIFASKKAWLKLGFVLGGVAGLPLIINKMFIKGGDINEVLSMTGRLPFWKALLNEGLVKEPWLGFGFMRIAYKDYFQSWDTYAGQMTHNTFIQVLMNLGFIGFGIVMLQMMVSFRSFALLPAKTDRMFVFGVLIALLVNSLTEFGIFGENNFGILFYQMLFAFSSIVVITGLSNYEKRKLQKLFSFLKYRKHSIN